MSELKNRKTNQTDFRARLLASASALALIGFVCTRDADADESTDKPTVWVELGGQFERLESPQENLPLVFLPHSSKDIVDVINDAQGQPAFSIGANGKISFEPENTNWIFTAGIQYGRSNRGVHRHHETYHPLSHASDYVGISGHPIVRTKFQNNPPSFGDGQTSARESHLIVDFSAGKDVGLGMFGANGTSIINAGIRFAQFSSSSDGILRARPLAKVHFAVGNYGAVHYTLPNKYRNFYTVGFERQRAAHAVGPSISWDASAPLIGHERDMTLAIDWGINASLLFGRQRAHVHHQTTSSHYKHVLIFPQNLYYTSHHVVGPYDPTRSKFVAIPNAGGFVGASLSFPNAKISLGYRADFFFGAMDGGVDTTKKENVGFYGPFASVSIGLGG